MYTEEELAEAVDILVEDYGFDEDEAIEMIYNEGIFNKGKQINALQNQVNQQQQQLAQQRRQLEQEKQRNNTAEMQGMKKGAIGTAAVVGGAMAINKMRKNRQAKRDAKLRSMVKSGMMHEEYDIVEEELLEALDILVEDYGIDEDDAIDMLLDEAFGLKARKINKLKTQLAVEKQKNNSAALRGAVGTAAVVGGAMAINKMRKRRQAKRDAILRDKVHSMMREDYEIAEDELLEAVDILVEDYGIEEDEAIDMVTESLAGGLSNFGAAKLGRSLGEKFRSLKANKNKQEVDEEVQENYEFEELAEAVDILVEEYGFDEDYAIDLVLESYEEDLLNEGILDRTQIPSEITYRRLVRANQKAEKYKKTNAAKSAKFRKKFKNLETKYRGQIKKFNNYENEKLARYKAKGKNPRTYTQITYKG